MADAPTPMMAQFLEIKADHPDALLLRIVTEGTEAVVGGDYRSNMIGYGEILTEDEILNVLAYIKSTWPDEIREMHDEMNARAAVD